ncbi:hypothetical protein [Pelomonas sp. KK5]|uniref:hypothetical protein n=1 Tax=Pelomonas sp. KK5 TaxID=1855730 RepID=UPI00097C212B|nr:hypothetical protein [Pelomonas sp. KK5]
MGGSLRTSWHIRLRDWLRDWLAGGPLLAAYTHANRDSIARALSGQDPFGSRRDEAAGARMVVSLSSAHVPAFCRASAAGEPRPYLNCHDLALSQGRPASEARLRVDQALPVADWRETYFGAVELNGCGIRYYGDVCLVLRQVPEDTVVLDRNSFELLRAPIAPGWSERPAADQARACRDILRGWSGRWGSGLAEMAAIKVQRALGPRDRRWTIGQVSQALCDDEDYLEVLRQGSFGAGDLQEARITAEDAAHDALAGNRLLRGPVPRIEALVWRQRRSRAERALREAGVPLHVVTGPGRARG